MTRHYLDILADVIRENWDKPALTDYATLDGDLGNSYTYGQMYEQILALCDRFRQLGIKPGDHIAICGANSANWAIAFLASAVHQGVSVAIMHTMPTEDIVRTMISMDVDALCVDSEILCGLPKDSLPRVVLPMETLCNDVSIKRQPHNVIFNYVDGRLLSTIYLTSGSSGASKGVMLSLNSVTKGAYDAIHILPDVYGLGFACILPLAHVIGLMGCLIAQLLHAHHIYMLPMAPISMIPEIMNHTHSYALVTVPLYITKLQEYYSDNLKDVLGNSFLEVVLGGARLEPSVERKLYDVGVPTVLFYGSTETTVISGNRWEDYKPGTSGRYTPGTIAKIDNNGEILAKGDYIMLGYYKDPEATAAKIDKDGWLHTGDRGHMDEDGYLYVEGRLEQDMIVLPSGENISPAKVEAIINACEGVEESIVLARNGKLLALVVLQTPSSDVVYLAGDTIAAQQNLRNHLLAEINPQLPAYSQLFGIEFLSEPLARTEKKTIKRYLYK